MPIELGIWRIDSGCNRLQVTSVFDESRLEEILEKDISIASPNWMVIGRQVKTIHGYFIDLLAIDRDGGLVVLELKRDKTPRDVVAQVIDYASWVETLGDEDIAEIFTEYTKKYKPELAGISIDKAFSKHFNVPDIPENLNENHQVVVVAAELDSSTERIVKYLSDKDISINAIFFRVFKDGNSEYLSRVWLLDPVETEAMSAAHGKDEEWNGEYYVSFGHDDYRHWEDAVKYGFISGGGDTWYSKTLGNLTPKNRIWVNIPGRGYAGVGIVKSLVVPLKDFKVALPGGKTAFLAELPLKAPQMTTFKNDPVKSEYMVEVEWIKTLPLEDVVHEKGFFGNQNTVCQPVTKKWSYTVGRLKQIFGI